MTRLSLFCLFLLCGINTHAAVSDYAAIPKKTDNFTRAEFRLWLDDKAPEPRALLLLASGWQDDGRGNVTNPLWQDFARKHHLGLVGVFYQCPQNGMPYYSTEGGSGEAFFAALSKLASSSKKPAIANLPVLIWGHSAGGQLGYGLACFKPERVIAFAAIKGGHYETKFNPLVRKVPGIFFIGDRDEVFRRQNITRLFEENRKAGAIWCLGIEPNAGHELGQVNTVIIPFFEAALAQRLPTSNNASLISLDKSKSWIGIRDSLEIKPPGSSTGLAQVQTVWLPDENTAKAWQHLSRGGH